MRTYRSKNFGKNDIEIATALMREIDPNNTLAFCAKQLITCVARTLRALELSCVTRFGPDDLLAVLPHLGHLTELRVSLIPFTPFPQNGAGRVEDTLRVQEAVRTHCPRLQHVEVVCHLPPPEDA